MPGGEFIVFKYPGAPKESFTLLPESLLGWIRFNLLKDAGIGARPITPEMLKGSAGLLTDYSCNKYAMALNNTFVNYDVIPPANETLSIHCYITPFEVVPMLEHLMREVVSVRGDGKIEFRTKRDTVHLLAFDDYDAMIRMLADAHYASRPSPLRQLDTHLVGFKAESVQVGRYLAAHFVRTFHGYLSARVQRPSLIPVTNYLMNCGNAGLFQFEFQKATAPSQTMEKIIGEDLPLPLPTSERYTTTASPAYVYALFYRQALRDFYVNCEDLVRVCSEAPLGTPLSALVNKTPVESLVEFDFKYRAGKITWAVPLGTELRGRDWYRDRIKELKEYVVHHANNFIGATSESSWDLDAYKQVHGPCFGPYPVPRHIIGAERQLGLLFEVFHKLTCPYMTVTPVDKRSNFVDAALSIVAGREIKNRHLINCYGDHDPELIDQDTLTHAILVHEPKTREGLKPELQVDYLLGVYKCAVICFLGAESNLDPWTIEHICMADRRNVTVHYTGGHAGGHYRSLCALEFSPPLSELSETNPLFWDIKRNEHNITRTGYIAELIEIAQLTMLYTDYHHAGLRAAGLLTGLGHRWRYHFSIKDKQVFSACLAHYAVSGGYPYDLGRVSGRSWE